MKGISETIAIDLLQHRYGIRVDSYDNKELREIKKAITIILKIRNPGERA